MDTQEQAKTWSGQEKHFHRAYDPIVIDPCLCEPLKYSIAVCARHYAMPSHIIISFSGEELDACSHTPPRTGNTLKSITIHHRRIYTISLSFSGMS